MNARIALGAGEGGKPLPACIKKAVKAGLPGANARLPPACSTPAQASARSSRRRWCRGSNCRRFLWLAAVHLRPRGLPGAFVAAAVAAALQGFTGPQPIRVRGRTFKPIESDREAQGSSGGRVSQWESSRAALRQTQWVDPAAEVSHGSGVVVLSDLAAGFFQEDARTRHQEEQLGFISSPFARSRWC